MTALELLFSVVLYGGLIWLIAKIPVDDQIKTGARVLVIILFAIHVLSRTGLLGALNVKL